MKKILLFLFLSFFVVSCEQNNKNLKPLEVVNNLDVKRYMGKWYEIASIPMKEQQDCVGTTATYTLKDNGEVKVFNECRQKTLDGKIINIEASAKVEDKNVPAKIKVFFFWIFGGDYWVIDLDKDYNYAVVGNPSRNYAWVLSRTPTMSDKIYNEILEKLKTKDYDISRLKKTLQPSN